MLIKHYPVCSCGHSKYLHRERFVSKYQETRKCGDPNYSPLLCFCVDYNFHYNHHYFDRYLAMDILKGVGKVLAVVLLIALSLVSFTVLICLGSAFVVAIPVILASLLGKH